MFMILYPLILTDNLKCIINIINHNCLPFNNIESPFREFDPKDSFWEKCGDIAGH